MVDHRAEAEKWLTEAANIWDEPRDHDDPPIDQLRIISRALIGIGLALLANLPTRYTVTATSPDERCPWWTNGKGSWALWAGKPSVRRCVLYAGHEGGHRDPPLPPRQPEETGV